MHTSLRCHLCTLLLFVLLSPSAYCIQACGLKLDKISQLTNAMKNVETNLYGQQVHEVVRLDEFLQAVVASNVESVSSENIEITLEVENVAGTRRSLD